MRQLFLWSFIYRLRLHTCVTASEDDLVKVLFHISSLWLLMVL